MYRIVLKLRIRLAAHYCWKARWALGEGKITKGKKFAAQAIRLAPSMCFSYETSRHLREVCDRICYEGDYFLKFLEKD